MLFLKLTGIVHMYTHHTIKNNNKKTCQSQKKKERKRKWGGDESQLTECLIGILLMQVQFPGAARDFSHGQFSAQTHHSVHKLLCAITCINICVHVKDPVAHVRVQWIMETLKYPACTVGWVMQLCHSWLCQGKAPVFSTEEIQMGQYRC